MLATSDAQSYFGSSLNTNQSFIEHIYANTLNKTVADDAAGIKYWVDLLDSGASRGEVVSGLIDAVAQYKNSTDATTKAAYDQFMNSVAVSDYMADKVEVTPDEYAQVTGFDKALTVTDSALSLTNALIAVNALAEKETISSNDKNVITLKKVVTETVTVVSEDNTTTYWGGPNGEKITIDSFYEMLRTVTGQDLFELANIQLLI